MTWGLTRLYMEESLAEVQKTLYEAIGLVILVIFVFLQDWRTTLIPVVTILSLGRLLGIWVSINRTLFGIILATGLSMTRLSSSSRSLAMRKQDARLPQETASCKAGGYVNCSMALSSVSSRLPDRYKQFAHIAFPSRSTCLPASSFLTARRKLEQRAVSRFCSVRDQLVLIGLIGA